MELVYLCCCWGVDQLVSWEVSLLSCSWVLQQCTGTKKERHLWTSVWHIPNVIYWTNKSQSKQRYQEHIKYIRHNEPQPAYAQHILKVKHEYGTINNTMILLKRINKTSLLLPYEQLCSAPSGSVAVTLCLTVETL